MLHEDKIGQPIFMHSVVNVDEPTGVWECHQNEFRGTVVHIGDLFITVEDQDGDCYDVPSEHLTVVIPDDGSDFEDEDNTCPDCGIGNTGIYMIDDNVGHGMHEERICNECGSK